MAHSMGPTGLPVAQDQCRGAAIGFTGMDFETAVPTDPDPVDPDEQFLDGDRVEGTPVATEVPLDRHQRPLRQLAQALGGYGERLPSLSRSCRRSAAASRRPARAPPHCSFITEKAVDVSRFG
jgi:hypothetical protein